MNYAFLKISFHNVNSLVKMIYFPMNMITYRKYMWVAVQNHF